MKKRSKKNTNVDTSYEVMAAVSDVIDFIRTQIVSDMKTASDKGLVQIENRELQKLGNIMQESISASFSKAASQIESKVKEIT